MAVVCHRIITLRRYSLARSVISMITGRSAWCLVRINCVFRSYYLRKFRIDIWKLLNHGIEAHNKRTLNVKITNAVY